MKEFCNFSIILLLFTTGCDLDFSPNVTGTYEEKLPEITTTGENTFGCKIDGEVFLPDFYSFMYKQSLFAFGKFSKENGYFEIAAINQDWGYIGGRNGSKGSDAWVELKFYLDSNKNIKEKAILKFTYSSKMYYEIIEVNKSINCDTCDNFNPYEIMKYDTTDSENIIFSCKFNGIVKSDGRDKKRITDGRFDVKIRKRDY